MSPKAMTAAERERGIVDLFAFRREYVTAAESGSDPRIVGHSMATVVLRLSSVVDCHRS